jgi:hypothetical protein
MVRCSAVLSRNAAQYASPYPCDSACNEDASDHPHLGTGSSFLALASCRVPGLSWSEFREVGNYN